MHQLMGARYTGCGGGSSGAAGCRGMMGSGTMGGFYPAGRLATMMGSDDWSWMTGGAWQHMTPQDWHRLEQRLLGTDASVSSGRGWGAPAIIAVTLGAVLLVAVVIFAVIRPPFRPPPDAASPT